MTSRVGHVAIRLRLPAELAEQAPAVRARVEDTVMVEVLEELERRVHARFGPGAHVHIRRLPVVWRLAGSALADPGLSARLGAELADAIIDELEALSPPSRLRPSGDGAVLFEDAHHAAAAYLADEADGRGNSWFHRARSDDAATCWREVIGGGEATVREVLRWLERMDSMETVLARRPETIAPLLAALPRASWPAAAAAARDRVERGSLSWTVAPVAPAEPRARHGFVAGGEPQAPAAPRGDHAAPPRAAASPADAPADLDATMPAAAELPSPTSAAPGDARHADGHRRLAVTDAAGLFYLIGRVLEIDLAERLWAAGLPEGDLLAHIAAAVLGDDRDPAWRWFGGVFERAPEVPRFDTTIGREIGEQVQHGLGVRLVRFGVDRTPADLEEELADLAPQFPPSLPAPPPLARLCSHAAAALACITAARLGVAPSAMLLRSVATRPGRLWLTGDQLVIEQPAAQVDLDHRRAGLDQDPGHVAWLDRRVAFEFTGGATL